MLEGPFLTGTLNANGTPRVKYRYTADHPGHVPGDGCGVLSTGPVKGEVVLSDGTRYDVSPEVIEFVPGHEAELHQRINDRLRETGQLQAILGDKTEGEVARLHQARVAAAGNPDAAHPVRAVDLPSVAE